MSLTSWRETRLNRALRESNHPDADLARLVVDGWLPEIETVLHAAGTAPTAFTLHDADHSFRVAERAVDIMPAGLLGKLNPVDITFLLLASYLHDIGMTPQEGRVSAHYAYLLSGDGAGLSSADIEEFQSWLDDDDRGITAPITNGTPSAQDLLLCRERVSHYCRFRHNDWSEAWIRAHLPSAHLYAGWIEELIRLCQSHHMGKAELRKSSFDPHIVGQNGQVLHLRYLACLLRIADILELDPERTPEAVFLQRDIPPDSLIYWHRDHALSIHIEDRKVIIYARPDKAVVHHAIEELINGIDHELQICYEFAAEIPFKVCPTRPGSLPHEWALDPLVTRDVEPQPGTYEYIRGAFLPNTRKLLKLLSGRELYGNVLAAVGEMVQNALDAVHEQIALTRLDWPDPLDALRVESLRRLHRVELRLEQRQDALWLVCTDTGVGMTKSIIERHLLVNGSPRAQELRTLARRCAKAGFALGCIGPFGMGALSYFMFGDRLQVTTTRSAEARDGESTGWSFTTEGAGSFGELRRQTDLARGSKIELRLYPEAIADPVAWFETLCSYLQRTLSRIPCALIVTTRIGDCRSLQLQPVTFLEIGVHGLQSTLARLDNIRGRLQRYEKKLHSAEQVDYQLQLGDMKRDIEKARRILDWLTSEAFHDGPIDKDSFGSIEFLKDRLAHRIAVHEVVSNSFQGRADDLSEREIQFRFEAPYFPALWLERSEVELVFTNLIDNIAKYASPHQTISIEYSTTVMKYCVAVISRGTPLREEIRDSPDGVFKERVRGVSGEIAARTEGKGQGLFISRRLARLWQGDLRLEYQHQDVEATYRFIVDFPKWLAGETNPWHGLRSGRIDEQGFG